MVPSLVVETFVVMMNIAISELLGVFPSLLFESVRIILTGDVQPLGLNSETIVIDHLRHNPSPDVEFLLQFHSPLGQLHGFLHGLPLD